MTQDSSHSSHSSKRPTPKRKDRQTNDATLPDGLAEVLTQRFPMLGPQEWDFRWIATKQQLAAVTEYERGREIMRLAQDSLLFSLEDPAKAKLAWVKLVTGDRLVRLMSCASIPGSSCYDLAKGLEAVMSAGHRFSKEALMPPPAFTSRSWIAPWLKRPKPKFRLMFQPQVEEEWRPDSEGDTPLDDRFGQLGWGSFPVPFPSHKFILHVPMFHELTRKEAQDQFRKWVQDSELFHGPGRGKTPALVALAFFRFNQGRTGLGVSGQFAQEFEPRNVAKGSVNTEVARFGADLFRPYINRTYAGVEVLWSRSLKLIADQLGPLASRLAHEAQIALNEAGHSRHQIPKSGLRFKRPS